MMLRYASDISRYLSERGYISNAETSLYSYALTNLIYHAMTFIPIIIVCLLTHEMLQSICLLIPFLAIRRYSGGLHFASARRCILFSWFVILATIRLVTLIDNSAILATVSLVACIYTCFKSPVISPARITDEQDHVFYRLRARQLCIVNYLLYLSFSILGIHQIAVCLATGQILVSLSQCIK